MREATIPKLFQEPIKLAVFTIPTTPKDRSKGAKKRTNWNNNASIEDVIIPKRSIRPFLGSLITKAETNISKKAANINQKVPMSNIVPKNETLFAFENKDAPKNATTMPRPANNTGDFGKIILPSENLAAAQKIIEITRPKTKRSPLEVSAGTEVKGKKKIGKRVTVRNNDQKEILSKIFDNIIYF